MEGNFELKKRRKITFSTSLAEVRLKLSILNSMLIFCAIGVAGEQIDYGIAGTYLGINLICLFVPRLSRLAVRVWRTPFLTVDLGITCFMLMRTGGVDSPLVPFLFIPILAAVVRYTFSGVFVWSTLSSVILALATVFNNSSDTFPTFNLLTKVGYFYCFGVMGSFLMKRTFTATEEVSKKLSQWNSKLERLTDYSVEITASSELDDIFVQTLKAVLHSDSSLRPAIVLFEGEVLKIYEQAGWEREWLDNFQQTPLRKDSLSLTSIQVFKEPLLCYELNRQPDLLRIFRGTAVKTVCAFPIVIDREVAGILLIVDIKESLIPDTQIRLLVNIANQCGNALQQLAKVKTAKTQADTDGLTSLFNRRYFNEQLELLSERSQQHRAPLSMILMDVDNFKKYNDTYGHPAGDQLLKVVASVITQVVDDEGIVARYGGEEFVVLLKDTDSLRAQYLAEQIRRAIEHIPESQLQCQITISVGVATMPDHAMDRLSLLEYTDKSLYHAKHSGKNRVCCGFETAT